MTDSQGRWEQRWHPLREEWVVYSAHRNNRPWSGGQAGFRREALPPHDPACYLCPGNTRVSGIVNPAYRGVYVFENDHPVVGPLAPEELTDEVPGLYRRAPALGRARVVCYDHRHHVTLNDLETKQVAEVLGVWREETLGLLADPDITFGLIFENRGKLCGVSSPHPHCQIYATRFVFKNVEREMEALARHRQAHGTNLFDLILKAEGGQGGRVVCQNEHAVAFVPFFARYSYEVWIFPRKRHAHLGTLSPAELAGLAAVYQELGRRYDLLFGMPFPYVMSLYQAPLDGADYGDYHLHFVFLPPLRRPDLQKYPAGPEIGGGNFMCDTLPEEKAAELKALHPSDYQVIP